MKDIFKIVEIVLLVIIIVITGGFFYLPRELEQGKNLTIDGLKL